VSQCSNKGDLLEQPLDFYEPDVLPATQHIVSKHCRKTQWFGRLLFKDMLSAPHVQPGLLMRPEKDEAETKNFM